MGYLGIRIIIAQLSRIIPGLFRIIQVFNDVPQNIYCKITTLRIYRDRFTKI